MNNKCIARNTSLMANPKQNYFLLNYPIRRQLRIVKKSKVIKGIKLTNKNIGVLCNPTKNGTVKNRDC
jgi:hypothetical protein